MSNNSLTIDSPQRCKLCGGTFTVRALIEAVSKFWPEIDVALSASPCCHVREELRIEHGRVWRGYVYAAGSPHFCGMEEYAVPALKLLEKGTMLSFELDEKEYSIPRRVGQ